MPLIEKFKIAAVSLSNKKVFCEWLYPLLGSAIQNSKSTKFILFIFDNNDEIIVSNKFENNDLDFLKFTYGKTVVEIAKNLFQNHNNQLIFNMFLKNFQNFILKNLEIITKSFEIAQIFSFILEDIGYFLSEK